MESLIPEYSAFGAVREAAGSALPGIAPSNAYKCSDGYVLIAGNGDSIFKRLMETIGRNDLGTDARPGEQRRPRGARRGDRRGDRASGRRRARSTDVLATLGAARVPAGKVYTAKDIARRPALPGARHDPAAGHARRLRARRAGRRAQAARPRRARCARRRRTWATTPTRVLARNRASRTTDIAALRGKRSGRMSNGIWNGARQAHLHAGSRHARRPAGRGGLRADRRQDRAGRRAVASGHGEDRGDGVRLAARRFRRCATPRSCCARSSASRASSTARWCPTCAAPSARSTRAPTSSTS